MAEQPPPQPLEPLESELIALGRTLVVDPPPHDLAERVLARIAEADGEAAGAPAAHSTSFPVAGQSRLSRWLPMQPLGWLPTWRTSLRSPRRRALATAIAALLVVVLVPPVRAAVLDLFRIGGVTVREVPSPSGGPATSDAPRPPSASPGAVVVPSLEEASSRVGFDIGAPPTLGAPTTIAVSRDARVVELTWGRGAGSTRLDVFDGSLSFGYLKSVWEAVTPTDVAGKEAVWFPTPHLIEWTDRAGVTVSSAPRVAGPTLVWVDRDHAGREITYRLEGPDRLETALAIAESVP
jgi:hypothetical protein